MAERGEGGDLHHGSSHDASPDDAANLGLPQPLRGEVDNGGPTGTESKGSMVAETAGSEIAESASVDKPTSTSTNPSKASPTKGYQYSPQTTPQPRDETSYFRPTETPSTSIHRGYPSHVSLSSSSKESSPLSSAHSSSVSIRAAAYSTRSSPGTSVPTDLLKDRQGTRDLSGLPTIGTNTTAAPTSAPVQARSTSRDDLSLIDSRQGYPVYPNQAFAALHSQIHPTYPSSSNRPRSSHRSPNFFGSNPAMSPQANRDYSPSENSSKTVGNTPASSPGLFTSDGHSDQQTYDEYGNHTSPYLTWTQVREPKETNKVVKSRDMISGRKSINQYEIISEVGRGISGKVKLGRNLETEEQVAIKVVPRYSKRRRLGRLGNPENDVKKEVAILKKARHEHIVALLEVIDDPDKAKVYIVLEYVALGEIPWRLRGKPEIVHVETRRIDRETRGIVEDEETIMDTQRVMSEAAMQRSRREQDLRRRQKTQARRSEFWSLEYGGEDDDVVTENAGSVKVPEQDTDAATLHRLESTTSLVSALTGRRSSQHTNSTAQGPLPYELDIPPLDSDNEDERSSSHPSHASSGIALQGSMAAELGGSGRRGRASSVAGSYVSNASADHRDSGIEDLSSVPILTLNQARVVLRDTVLGLEYLHYQGIIHRDIKPANLLWTSEHRVKISDFGVSYLGQPIQLDEAGEETTESEVKPLDEAIELAKTVGTPAFYAPELCRTDFLETGDAPPPVTGQIDVWALGVTLFCIVFARLPFIADDQFAMFKAIAEDELHIPRRRLKAVDTTGVSRSSSYSSKSTTLQHQYRSETELVYDRIDDDLYDLLKRLLIKDPTKRITIREIKRHPWVLEGISDPIAWLDETDPDRQHKGKKIEVSNEDIEQAVVPLGLIERMRSGVRKLGHAFGLGKVKDGRRRADSAFRSSDSPPPSTPNTSNNSSNRDLREARRASLRGDETILSALKASREGEHPLAHSVTASPDLSERPDFFQLPDGDTSATRSASLVMQEATAATPSTLRPTGPDRALSNSGASVKTIRAYQPVEPTTPISPGLPGHPTAVDPLGSSNLSGIFGGATRRTLVHKSSRSMAWSSEDEASSSGQDQSVDRVTMGSEDPHAVPSVAFSSTVAEGRVDTPAALVELPGSRPQMAVIPPSFDGRHPDLPRPSQASGRPTTAPATETPSVPVRRTSLRRPGDSTPEAFQRAQDEMVRRRQLEYERSQWKPPPAQSSALAHHSDAAPSSCPPSPDDDIFFDRQEEKVRKLQEGITPLPAPAQPMISSSSDDHFASSTSQTSHPSVISAGSSVTADDLPYHSKPVGGPAPAPAVTTISTRSMVSDDDPGYSGDHAAESGDEDEDSDDDEDLVMMPRRKTKAPDLAAVALPGSLAVEERRGRRDTGASVKTSRSGSSETTLRKVGSKEAVGK